MELLFGFTLQKIIFSDEVIVWIHTPEKDKYFPLSLAGSGQQHADSVAEVNPRNQRRLGSGHGV